MLLRTNRCVFPKSARLLTSSEYQAVFDYKCRASDKVLLVFARPNDQGTARLGLAISRKCSKRALDRNRIKRALRETFRLSRSQLPALDLVVVCRSSAVESSRSVLGTSLLTQINKVRHQVCAD